MDVSLQAGRVVGDHWRLQRRLGGDVSSRFWEAEDLRGGSNVAVEFAFIDVEGPDARLRFSRETRALMKLHHPNVVRTLYRGIVEDSLAFAVTELLRGEDLVARLVREPALGLAETAQILDVVCRVVNRLEVANIAQQVLEPKHVFFAIEPLNVRIVKLLNIGFAEVGVRTGSPYVSPERVSTNASIAPPRGAAQVWAIGVLGYRMLAGELPFAPGTRELDPEWASRLARLGERPGELPPELDEWFRTAIHPDPQQRFGSAEQAGLAFGHIASTYASSLARTRRERPAVREAGTGSVVTGAGAIVWGRTPGIEGPTGTSGTSIKRSDESGVRLALAQPATPSSSIPPPLPKREKRNLQFPLGRVAEPPSLATRAPELSEPPAPVDEPTLLIGRAKLRAASERSERSRRLAVGVLAVAIGVLAGYSLRSVMFVLERGQAGAATSGAALRSVAPPHAIVPVAPPPAAAPAEPVPQAPRPPVSTTASPQPSTDLPSRSAGPPGARPVRPGRERLKRPEPAEPVDSENRPLISSRQSPANTQLAVSRSSRAKALDADLPAAPPPLDTTPIQVYRGF
jgi:serine/threonine protein kinase